MKWNFALSCPTYTTPSDVKQNIRHKFTVLLLIQMSEHIVHSGGIHFCGSFFHVALIGFAFMGVALINFALTFRVVFSLMNMGMIALHPVKSTQFAFFDAVMAFLMSIFLKAYFICKQLGLLFHPLLDRIQENSNSTWSCENLYVSKYLNGSVGSVSILVAIDIFDFTQATKPMMNVFL